MGHTVKYTYESGNLASVTQPGESSLRWQFKYNASHGLTSETDGRGHTVTTEYDIFGRVVQQTDAMSRTRTWVYGATKSGTETTITEPNGAVTAEQFNSVGLPTSVTHASGTSIAATTTYEYNGSDELIALTDPNKHKVEYGYDEAGNRTSEKDADSDETKWKYDSKHDIETVATPDGETTTIKREANGNPESISRPAPGEKTQTTKYKYDTSGDLESVTDPLERTWKYEYDSRGDKTAEIDPEGNKRTWGYNEDSQETSMVSPRGNAKSGEAAKYTTTIERDTHGRPLVVTEPGGLGGTGAPTDRTQAAVSGTAREGQTLTAATGTWEGEPTVSYTYQWQRCNASGGSCSNVSGATSSTYALASGDVGTTLRVVVTATNSWGSAESRSNTTAVVSKATVLGAVYSTQFSTAFGSGGSGNGQFEQPRDVAVDSNGDVWVADTDNNRVEEFSSTGEYIKKFGSEGTGNGQFKQPAGIAVAANGDLWVTDSLNDRVEEFSPAGEYIKKFGSEGSGNGQFSEPRGIAIAPNGHIWVTDARNYRVEEFSSTGEYITKVGTSGSGNGQFYHPTGIAADSNGDIWVADSRNNRVQELSSTGEYIRQFGSEGTGNGQFIEPAGITVDPAGDVWVADTRNNRIQGFTSTGEYIRQFGSDGSGNGQFVEPEGIAVGPNGNLWIADRVNNRIQEFTVPTPVYGSKFGSEGSGNGQFKQPRAVAIDSSGDVWVADTKNNRVEEFSSTGEYIRQFGSEGTGNGQFKEPRGIAFAANGDLWVTDSLNDRVEEFSPTGEYITKFGSEGSGNGQFTEPVGIAIAPNGHIWVTDARYYRVEEFSSTGEYITQVGIYGSGNGQFYHPTGVVADPNGNIWVADTRNNRVQELSSTGEYIRQFGSEGTGNGQFKEPAGIAVDLAGDIWVADTQNNRIEGFSSTGEYITQVGTKGTGSGQFTEPEELTVDRNDNLWVADRSNNRVDEWRSAVAPSNTTPPSISGQLLIGQTLSAGTGTWTAVPSPTYTYQWRRCNKTGGECSNISGATGSTHIVTESDAESTLRVVVTATNSAGSAEGTSAATEVAGQPPTTKYAYDADGNLESVIDPNGNKTKYTYDADNERTAVEEPKGTVTETGYDASGQVTSQTDGNKHTTKYVRNLLEEVTEVVDPLGRKTTKEYDPAGNLTSLSDPMKRTTTYTYNLANRLIEVKYSDGKTPTVKYEYTKDGDRTVMTDGTGTSKYTYDQLDRLTEAESGHKEKVKYEYDLANEQTKITYPSEKSITRACDKDGRLEKVTDWLEHITKFTYDPDSDLATTVFPSGTSDEDKYTYNNADQMSEVKMLKGTETLASLVFARDNDEQVKTVISKGLPGAEKLAYEYDSNSRLTKGATTAYEYDAANNPTKIATGTYKYNAGDELETGPSLTYTYNEVGERTKTTPSTGPATTYGYDQAGNLTSVGRPKEGEVSKIEDSYAYNGEGLRTSQTISGTTSYLTWDMAEDLPLIVSDGTNSYIYGPGGLPVEQISSGGTVTYLHHDRQGSTRLLTGSTGTVTGSTTFDAYGNKTGSTGSSTTPLGYDGQYTSSDTGLIYLRARVYDPATAQFLTVDPLAPITEEPYTYGADDPINSADPSGLIFGIPGTPSWSDVGTRVVGFFDGFTKPVFGGTAALRFWLGLNGGLETCSMEYKVANEIGGVDVQIEAGAVAGNFAEFGLEALVGKLGGLRAAIKPLLGGIAGALAQNGVAGQEPSASTIGKGAAGGLVGDLATGFFSSGSAEGVSGGVGAVVNLLTN